MLTSASCLGSAIEAGTDACAAQWTIRCGSNDRATPDRRRSRMSSRSSRAPGLTWAALPVDRSSTTSTSSPLLDEPVHDMRADEAGAAGYENAIGHGLPFYRPSTEVRPICYLRTPG